MPGRKNTLPLLVPALLLALRAAPVQAKKGNGKDQDGKRRYTVGVSYGFGVTQDTDLKMLHLELIKRVGQRLKVAFTLKVFHGLDPFHEAIAKGELDFVQAPLGGASAVPLAMQKGYDPLMLLTVKGERHDAMCLFTLKNGGPANWKDMKDKRLLLTPEKMSYFLLREKLDRPPEKYFSSLELVKSTFSGFYGLTLGQGDGVFSSAVVYKGLKDVNPGAVARLRQGDCAKTHVPLPLLLAHNRVEKKMRRDMLTLSQKANRDELFKPFWPLWKKFKINLVQPKKADYEPLVRLWRDAVKKGWEKDFDRWRKGLEKNKER